MAAAIATARFVAQGDHVRVSVSARLGSTMFWSAIERPGGKNFEQQSLTAKRRPAHRTISTSRKAVQDVRKSRFRILASQFCYALEQSIPTAITHLCARVGIGRCRQNPTPRSGPVQRFHRNTSKELP
jgi:hypothetical protein